jgi:hypothetical protein
LKLAALSFVLWAGAAAAQTQMLIDRNDPALEKMAGLSAAGPGIGSVADGATEAAKMPGKTGLVIVGHGSEGLIGMGSGESGSYVKGKDLEQGKLGDVDASLKAIAKTLAASGNAEFVLLCGCSSGGGSQGQALVTQLSSYFPNAFVVASTVKTGLYFQKGAICAGQMGVKNVGSWTSRQSIGARGGQLLNDDDLKAAVQAVNAASCVKCDQPSKCKSSAARLRAVTAGSCPTGASLRARGRRRGA